MTIPRSPAFPASAADVAAWLDACARAFDREADAYAAIGCVDRPTAGEVARALGAELLAHAARVADLHRFLEERRPVGEGLTAVINE